MKRISRVVRLIVSACLLGPMVPYVQADEAAVHAVLLLDALRADDSAGIRARAYLVGTTIPESGTLTGAQVTELYGLLYNADGSHSLAWDDPTTYARNLVAGAASLAKMRERVDDTTNTNDLTCLQVLHAVTGTSLPPAGTLSGDEIDRFFALLFGPDGSCGLAYTDPLAFCRLQFRAYTLMACLLGAGQEAQAAFVLLYGVSVVDPAYSDGRYVQKLFDISTSGSYTTPSAFIDDLRAGGALLAALREPASDPANTNGVTGVQVVAGMTGDVFPASGPLSGQAEFDSFYGLMFDAEGNRTLAYSDPGLFCSQLFRVYDLMTGIWNEREGVREAFSNLYGIGVTTPVYSNDVYRQRLLRICGDPSYVSAGAYIYAKLRRGQTRGGIPHGYLRQRGITNAFGEVSDDLEWLDSDGDGRNNLKEYIAGTEITNAASRLTTVADRSERLTEGLRLWIDNSSTARVYFVQGKASIRSPGWQEYTNAPGNGGRLELVVPTVSGIRFHRMGVRMEVLP